MYSSKNETLVSFLYFFLLLLQPRLSRIELILNIHSPCAQICCIHIATSTTQLESPMWKGHYTPRHSPQVTPLQFVQDANKPVSSLFQLQQQDRHYLSPRTLKARNRKNSLSSVRFGVTHVFFFLSCKELAKLKRKDLNFRSGFPNQWRVRMGESGVGYTKAWIGQH